MQVDGLSVQISKRRVCIQPLGDFICFFGVITHHKKQCFFAAWFPFLARFLPAGIAKPKVFFITISRVIISPFLQVAHMPDDRNFHNPCVHCFAQGRIGHDVFEQVTVVVFGRGRKVELGRKPKTVARFHFAVQRGQNLVPG